MTIIRCTKKLLDTLGPSRVEKNLAGVGSKEWHANIFTIDRQKAIIFTHGESLFSVVIFGALKRDLPHLDESFRQRLFKALIWDGFPQSDIESALSSVMDLQYTGGTDRSVLGSMNEMVHHIKWWVPSHGGIERVDLMSLHKSLNETIFKAIGYLCPREAFRKYLNRT